MQVQSMAFCKKNLSLRKAIVNSPDLEGNGFYLIDIKKENRGNGKGWTKIYHTELDGSINLRWNANLQGLEIWTISRNSPFPIYGRFIMFLEGFAKGIRSIAISIS